MKVIKKWKKDKNAQSEVVAWRCSLKKVFLEILQNLQENICGRVYSCNFMKI